MYMYKFNFIFLVEPPRDFMHVAEQQCYIVWKNGNILNLSVHSFRVSLSTPCRYEFTPPLESLLLLFQKALEIIDQSESV